MKHWVWLCLLLCAPTAQAEIYTFVDAEGIRHYSNLPPDGAATQRANAAQLQAARQRVTPVVEAAASTTQLEPALLHAVITAESAYDARAVSRAGAMGLMQLMPGTAERYGVTDAFDPEQNIHAGARYLSDLLRQFDQDLPLALAAYNAGEQAVLRHGRQVPPYRETRAYVRRVMALQQRYRGTL